METDTKNCPLSLSYQFWRFSRPCFPQILTVILTNSDKTPREYICVFCFSDGSVVLVVTLLKWKVFHQILKGISTCKSGDKKFKTAPKNEDIFPVFLYICFSNKFYLKKHSLNFWYFYFLFVLFFFVGVFSSIFCNLLKGLFCCFNFFG